MFDITTAELLVVVTGAGMLLGRKEITRCARVVGWSMGKFVGSLQGIRIRYEQKTHGTQLYQLHKQVKDGLVDMRTIGSDLNALSNTGGRMAHSVSQQHNQVQQQQMPLNVDVNRDSDGALKRPGGILGSLGGNLGTSSGSGVDASTTSLPLSHPAKAATATAASSYRLAQLILAENVLLKEKGPASALDSSHRMLGGLEENDSSGTNKQGKNTLTGSDLVEMCLCESIVNESYIVSQSLR